MMIQKSNITDKMREGFVADALVYKKTAKEIADKYECSTAAVNRTVMVFSLVRAGEWDELIQKISASPGYGTATIKWACNSLGIDIPEDVSAALDSRSKRWKEYRETKQETPTRSPEPKKPVPEAYTTEDKITGVIADPAGPGRVICTLYICGKEVGKCAVSLRRDINDETLKYAQAIIYGAHSLFKFEQARAASEGDYFEYRSFRRSE